MNINSISGRSPARMDDDEDGEGPGGFAPERTESHIDRHLLEARTLMVTGAISDELARRCAARMLVMEQMDSERPVTVFINSPGGSADSGFALYDMLRFVRCPVRTIVNGLCASAAVLVHLATAKEHRFTMPQSRFLLHQPSTTGYGTASDLDITAREVIKLRQRYNEIIAEATGRDVEQVHENVVRDFWLNSEEALEYGLVSAVVSRRADLPE